MAIVFDVVAKVCTEATSLLKFCMACSDGLDLPLGADVAGFGCAAGMGNMYTWSAVGGTSSGLFLG